MSRQEEAGMGGGCIGTWVGGALGALIGAGYPLVRLGGQGNVPDSGFLGTFVLLVVVFYAAIGEVVGALLGAAAGVLIGLVFSGGSETALPGPDRGEPGKPPPAPSPPTASEIDAEIARLKGRLAELEQQKAALGRPPDPSNP